MIGRLPADQRQRLEDAIDGLPTEGDVVRLQGMSGYRLRVGRWRIRFEVDEQARVITVMTVRPRGDAYKRR
jgi:mRNA interferase RelE/StbE